MKAEVYEWAPTVRQINKTVKGEKKKWITKLCTVNGHACRRGEGAFTGDFIL